MCEPTSILALSSLAIGAASAGVGYIGQVQQANAQSAMAEENQRLANQSYRTQQQQLATHLQEQRTQFVQQDQDIAIQAEQARAAARVSAAESGVSGVSLDAIIGQTDREAAKATFANDYNYRLAKTDTARQTENAYNQSLDRRNSVPFGMYPNALVPILQVGSSALNTYASYFKPTPHTKAAY